MEEAIVISPLEEKMEQDLVKANVTDAVISKLKADYGDLKLRSVDDKEKYIEIREAAKVCAKVRTATTKVCKLGREEAVAIQKKWVAKEKEVIAKIAEVEDALDAEISKFDAEVKRKAEEEKQRQETQYMQRTQALTKMGALYSDNSFSLGEFSLEANLVKESSQEIWDDEILPKFSEQHLIIEAERIEQEKIKAEKEAELRRQQEELAQKQRDFEAQQVEFKRQQEEIAKAEREKIQAEEQEKQRQRTELQNKRVVSMSPYLIQGEKVDLSSLYTLTEDDFANTLAEKKKLHEEYQQKLAEQIQQAAALKERQRIEDEKAAQELKRQQEEARKAEELAKAGDKAIWADFIQKINALPIPTVKSRQYKQMSVLAKEKIEEILQLKP